MSAGLPPIRRVVTGHDANGVAKVLIDALGTNVRSSRPGSASTLMWSTDQTPADISIGENIEDLGARTLGTAPPANGTRFTINDIPAGRPGLMHRTETLDYAIVLAGEIDMVMDDFERDIADRRRGDLTRHQPFLGQSRHAAGAHRFRADRRQSARYRQSAYARKPKRAFLKGMPLA